MRLFASAEGHRWKRQEWLRVEDLEPEQPRHLSFMVQLFGWKLVSPRWGFCFARLGTRGKGGKGDGGGRKGEGKSGGGRGWNVWRRGLRASLRLLNALAEAGVAESLESRV